MLRKHLLFNVLAFLFFSCSQELVVEDVIEIESVAADIPVMDTFNYDTLSGMYIGDFGGSDIRIIINYISKTNAIGYNIHRGLQRNINGKVTRHGDSIIVRLAEPGDHKYDGVFELMFLENYNVPIGKWISNSGDIPEKTVKLKKLQGESHNADWDDDINAINFYQYVEFANNAIGEFTFEQDGLVIFSYYPEGSKIDWDHLASARIEQSIEITGNWSVKDDQLILSWEKNTVFPTSIMVYQIKKQDYDLQLIGKNDTIITNMYP